MINFPYETILFEDVQARGVPVYVVSAKLPERWIIRAIGPFREYKQLYSWVTTYVNGTFISKEKEQEIEWTRNTYWLPYYLVYGSGDIKGTGWPQAGVWMHRYIGNGVYGPGEMLREERA